MTPELEFIEAVSDLARLIEADTRPALQIHRDKALKGAARRIERLARKRFRAQMKALLDSHALRRLQPKEADAPQEDAIRSQIAAAISDVILHQPLTAVDVAIYDGAISQAISAGASGIAQSMGTVQGSAESFIAEYIKDAGLSQLTGDIDKTTVDRLASAIATAYEDGADFDGVVKAIKSELSDMTAYRAKMIAQTELNDAYNQSILHFGREAGAEEKWWETDLAPCPVCIENALAGRIPIDSDFPSGDDAAPGHPSCLCSTGVGIAL